MYRWPDTAEPTVSTIDTGRRAEQAAADYLVREGFEIVEVNFRRRNCEIDIVARSKGNIFFVEVKYRATNLYGSGFDYITAGKLHHMQRAAEMWVRERNWHGEYTLSAIEVSGPDFGDIEFIESVY